MKYRTLSTILISVFITTNASTQQIVREMYVRDLHVEALRALTQSGTILARYTDPRTPIISTDGGSTYRRILTVGELIDIGNKTTIAADGNGHGIVAGSYRLLTSDAGEHWEKVEGGLPLETKGFQLQTDGNGRDLYLIGDYGKIKRSVVLPDTFPDKDTWEGIAGYSYGRGSITRTTDGGQWYCVSHTTGDFTLRTDFPAVKSYNAGELANGAKMFAFMPKFGKLMICLPGDTCIKIDSLLDSYGHMLMDHFNEYIVQDFASGSQAVILGPTGYRIIDARKLVPGFSGDLYVADCNSIGLVVYTTTFCAMILHDGSEAIIVPITMLRPNGVFALTGKRLLFQDRYTDMVAIDFTDGTVRIVGSLDSADADLAGRTRVRDVTLASGSCIAYYESGHVLDIDTLSNDPFEIAFSTAGRVVPEKLNLYELQSLAIRRTEAIYGCSGFTAIASNITASGTSRGIRLEYHATKVEKKALSDTITAITSLNNGETIVAAHRKAWMSIDTGSTWTEMTTPNLGTVISGYASAGNSEFIGYRGFVKSVNDSIVDPIPGGLYMRSGSNDWTLVKDIPNNYIYGITVDAEGTLWVVATNARLNAIVDRANADSVMQIETLQNNISVYRSQNAGASWQLIHTETIGPDFESITGVVSQSTTGHVLAMPSVLLHLSPGATTFSSIDIFPFGSRLYSAQLDAMGHAWVAASNGLYEVDVNHSTTVNESHSSPRTITIVPNPVMAGSTATIQCSHCTSGEYVVYDILGNEVASVTSSQLSTIGYAPGMYYLRNGDNVVRVIVQ